MQRSSEHTAIRRDLDWSVKLAELEIERCVAGRNDVIEFRWKGFLALKPNA